MYNFLTKNGQTIAFGVGALIVLAFFGLVVSNGKYELFTQMDMDGVKDEARYELSLFDFGLYATIGLIIVAAVSMVAFGIYQVATDLKGSLGGLVGLALIVIIFAIGYSMTQIETSGPVHATAMKFGVEEWERKIIGGSITTGVALIGLATFGIVVSEIRNFFK